MLPTKSHSLYVGRRGLARPGSDQAASHATITNGKLENERVLFSAAGAFLGYDLFIQETGEIVREMQ